jgi:GGDEF domain-containing protein
MTQHDDDSNVDAQNAPSGHRPLIIALTLVAVALSVGSIILTDLSAVFAGIGGLAAVGIGALGLEAEKHFAKASQQRIEDSAAMAAEIERLAWQDKATGLFSFSWFQQALEREVSRSGRYDQECTMLWLSLDLEHLRAQSPHAANTDPAYVWRFVADLATAAVRDTDSVAKRPGEFSVAILLPQSDIEGGKIVLQRLSRRLAEEKLEVAGSDPIEVQFRQRAVSFPTDGSTAKELMNAIQGRS